MDDKTKKILLISGGVLVVAAICVGLYLLSKDSDQQKDKDQNDEPDSNDQPEPTPAPVDPGTIAPQYDIEGQLKNPLPELVGRTLYPKRKEVGGMGYTNVRSSTEVNTDRGWWDFSDNLLTTINSGVPIGTVITEAAAEFDGFSYRWFKVKLYKATGYWGMTYQGYVRADTVTIKPYKK